MWGPATVPGLGHHSSVGLGQQQAAAPAAARLPDDFPVLDFPDWDGPGQPPQSIPTQTLGSSAAAEELIQSIAQGVVIRIHLMQLLILYHHVPLVCLETGA